MTALEQWQTARDGVMAPRCFAILLMSLATVLSCVAQDEKGDGAIRLLDNCGGRTACIEMLPNYGSRGSDGVLFRRMDTGGGYAEFELNVEASSPGGHPAPQMLVLRGWVDGLECCDFGQATVAVLGFSGAGNPILLTDEGPLEVHGGAIEVGCATCARLLDRKTMDVVSVGRTPSWDLRLVSGDEDYLTYDAEGRLYFFKGGRCLRLAPDELFEQVDRERCRRPREAGYGDRPALGLELEPGEFLLDVPGTPFVLLLSNAACT
ncbi:MAG: hypothetical protein Kow0062_15140 [Acidobacteriota bacterium]